MAGVVFTQKQACDAANQLARFPKQMTLFLMSNSVGCCLKPLYNLQQNLNRIKSLWIWTQIESENLVLAPQAFCCGVFGELLFIIGLSPPTQKASRCQGEECLQQYNTMNCHVVMFTLRDQRCWHWIRMGCFWAYLLEHCIPFGKSHLTRKDV